MKCKGFKKNLLPYIESEPTFSFNEDMKAHMETCEECKNIYKNNLEIKASLKELLNPTSKEAILNGSELVSKLNEKYYSKSFINKLSHHFKRNKLRYSAVCITFFALVLSSPYIKGVVAHKQKINNIISNNTQSIIRYNIATKSFDGELLEIHDPTKIIVGYSLQDSKANKTTSQIAKTSGAVAAINAGAFIVDPDNNGIHGGVIIKDGQIGGVIIKDGQLVLNDVEDTNEILDVAAFTQKGLLIVGEHTLSELKELNIKEGVAFRKKFTLYGLPLIVNGKAVTTGISDGGINPITAIGQKADGSVLMLVINGRSIESPGASLEDAQRILLQYGAINAANLSDGSHSTMYYNGEVISKPCSSSGERTEPSVFMAMP